MQPSNLSPCARSVGLRRAGLKVGPQNAKKGAWICRKGLAVQRGAACRNDADQNEEATVESGKYGVKPRGERWLARPYVRGIGHIYAGTHDTQEEAVKAALRILDEERRLSARETVDAFAARWVRDWPRPKASTNDTYHTAAVRFAKEFGDRPLHRVTPREARKYVLKHRSDLFALSAMFADARREGLVLRNPFAELRIPRGRGRRDIVSITEEELEILAGLARVAHGKHFGPVFRSIVIFSAYTGLRPGELLGLDRSDIELSAGVVHVRRQLHRGQETLPKSGATRVVQLLPLAMQALRDLPPRLPRPICSATGGEILFPGKEGQRITQPTLSGYWKPVRVAFEAQISSQRLGEFQAGRGAGKSAVEFHGLRHFYATQLVERGIEPWVIAKQLGHRDGGRLVRLTYGHPRDEIARERLRRAFAGRTELASNHRVSPKEQGVAMRGKTS